MVVAGMVVAGMVVAGMVVAALRQQHFLGFDEFLPSLKRSTNPMDTLL